LEKDSDWDRLASIMTFYYRSAVHKATKFTPALLMLGRELNMGTDLAYPPIRPSQYHDYDDYMAQLEKRLVISHEFARKNLEMDWKTREDSGKNKFSLKSLDLSKPVYVFCPSVARKRSPKFSSMWTGPCKLVEQLSAYLFRVEIGGRNKVQVIHRGNLYQP
jgi:hypothetical protein